MEIPEYDDPDIGREDYEFPDIGREETNSNNDISEDEPEVEGMVQDQFGAQVNEQNGTSSQCSSYVDLLNFKSNQFPLPTAFTLLERPLNGGGVQLNSGNQTQQQLQNRSFLELSRDGLQVVYVGAGQTDNEAASIRSNYSISPQVGIYYYEVAILDRGREGFIAVGLCARTVNLGRLTGWEPFSIGYHGDDGMIYSGTGTGVTFGPPFTSGDTIGCGVDFVSSRVYFTKNGKYIGSWVLPWDHMAHPMYASVGLRTPNERVKANFSGSTLSYDICAHVKMMKKSYQGLIHSARPQPYVASPTDQIIILSYLIHNGYEETARSFYQGMAALLKTPSTGSMRIPSYLQAQGEELDCEFSKVRIRRSLSDMILEGRIEEARALLASHYPLIIEGGSGYPDSAIIQFCLTAQSFIESVRKAAMTKRSNTTEDPLETLLAAGVELQRLAGSVSGSGRDSSGFICSQYSLDDLFALLAYADPIHSPLEHLFGQPLRERLALLIDQAVLHAEGQDAQCALAKLYQQLRVSLDQLQQIGSPMVAFLDVEKELF